MSVFQFNIINMLMKKVLDLIFNGLLVFWQRKCVKNSYFKLSEV